MEEYDQNENQPKEKKRGRAFFAMGMISGLLVSIAILCLVLFGVKGYYLITGKSVPGSACIVNNNVSMKVTLIQKMIDAYYLNDVTEQELEDGIYKGVVASLEDPYSTYYTKDELDSMKEMSSGIYCGVGIYMSQDPDTKLITVVKPVPNSPAEKAGVEPDDILYAVDGQIIADMQLSEVVTKVKGEENTPVILTFYRNGEKIDIELERSKIESVTVESEMKENQTGYIRIAEFDDVTKDQFRNALDDLKKQGMKSLIIDLRDNPGGNLDTVVAIADMLLPEGMIVYTEDKYGKKEEYKSDDQEQLTIPMAVLINGNSASASEILAGAIKDYHLGKLVGTTTFGKGIVQRLISLGDGTAVKLTISKYYTPSGNNIHGIGIEPDVEVKLDKEAYIKDGTDNQLDKALELLQ